MSDETERDKWLRDAVRRNLPMMQDSAIFLALFTANYEKDALAVLQFGLGDLARQTDLPHHAARHTYPRERAPIG